MNLGALTHVQDLQDHNRVWTLSSMHVLMLPGFVTGNLIIDPLDGVWRGSTEEFKGVALRAYRTQKPVVRLSKQRPDAHQWPKLTWFACFV